MRKVIKEEIIKINGKKSPGKFTGIFEYTPPEEELFAKRGKIFAVLEITADEKFDVDLAAKLAWGALQEEYFSPDTTGTPLKALEKAVLAVQHKLINLTYKAQSPQSKPVDFNLAVVSLWGEVIYLIRLGSPCIYLKRHGQVREPLKGESPLSSVSATLEDGDVIMAGSSNFSSLYSTHSFGEFEDIKRRFYTKDVKDRTQGFSAFVLRLRLGEVPDTEEVLQIAKADEPKLKFLKSLKKKIRVLLGSRIERGAQLHFQKSFSPPTLTFDKKTFPYKKVVGVLAFIFIVSVSFTLFQSRRAARLREFNALYEQVQQSFTKAEGFAGINKEEALVSFQDGKEALEKAEIISSKDPRLSDLKAKAQTVYNKIENITLVSNDNLFYDLNLPVDGADVKSIGGVQSQLLVSEQKSSSIFRITSPEGSPVQAEEATKNTVKASGLVVAEEQNIYLLTDSSLHVYSSESGKEYEPLDYDGFASASSFDVYSGNIYLLRPDLNQIHKFVDLGSGNYSKAVNWVKEEADLKNASSISIEGNIFVLNGQDIIKMGTGKRQEFSLKGLTEPLSNPVKIFTRAYTTNIYVADRGMSRVVVFNKDGVYVGQYKGDLLGDIRDVWVSQDGWVYMLSGSKIYKAK